jgi:hypothetical protein
VSAGFWVSHGYGSSSTSTPTQVAKSAINGHFLYTFVEDSPGQVTGQGVQNFSVATPGLAPNHGSAVSGTGGTTPARSASGYSY